MSSILIGNARNLQVNEVHVRRIFDLTARVFDMMPALPWMGIDGEALEVPRVAKDFAPTAFPETGGKGVVVSDISADPGTDFTSAVPNFAAAKTAFDPSSTSYFVRELVGDVDMSSTIRNLLSGQNPQREFQLDAKLTATAYAFAQQFLDASGSVAADDEFSGLDTVIAGLDASQTATFVNTGSRTKTRNIESLLALVRDGEGKPDFLLMSFDGLVSLKDGIREAGAQMTYDRDPESGLLVPYYDGVRIYVNDFIPTSTDTTSVYAGVLGRESGLYGIYPNGVGDRGLVVSTPEKHPTADYTITRIHWFCGLATLGGRSLAKLASFPTTTGS